MLCYKVLKQIARIFEVLIVVTVSWKTMKVNLYERETDFIQKKKERRLIYKGSYCTFFQCCIPCLSSAFYRDANLWRPKIGRLSFFYFPPGISTTPPRRIDPAPNGNDLGHDMTSYMMYILSKVEC